MSFPKYEAYKDSGVEWLGEVPEPWELKKFRYVFQESPEKITEKVVGEMLSVSGYRGIELKVYDDDNRRRTDDELVGYRIVRLGQLVVNTMWLNYAGLGVSEHQGHVSPAYRSYWIEPDLDKRYIHHLIRSGIYVQGYTQLLTGIRPNSLQMGRDDLLAFPVLLPTRIEQTQIARFLDRETARIDELIAEQQRLIELLKEKRQAVISHAVTKGLDLTVPMKDSGVEWLGEVPEHWDVMQFKFVTNLMQTGPFGSQLHADEYIENGVPLINPAHIVNGQIVPDSNVSVDSKIKDQLPRHHLKENNLILARRGELGRCAVVRQQHSGWLCGSGSMRVELSNKLMSEYAYLLISSEAVKAELSVTSKGSTMDNLNPEILGAIRLPIPLNAEQKKILEKVKEISEQYDKLTNLACRQVELLQERRSALISAAVTGKIDVRGWRPLTPAMLQPNSSETED